MQQQSDPITWRDGDVPVSTRFDDPFFSLNDGVAETRHVFMAGNDLPARFREGFAIAELGFGTGLNLLVAWEAFARACPGGTLDFTSFEAFPLSRADMVRAHRAFPDFGGKREALSDCWTGTGGAMTLPGLRLNVITGDARQTLPGWQGAADAWFLDGFAPAKNPELWSADLMAEVGAHTAAGGTAATYTAAGDVRRALAAAGFAVERVKGHGRKRHMTRARLAG
ncbi:FAD-dependent oxidoreductase [Sulfitobacter alexandrii]|uniref:FAD-dependent oxidoreductase n=1 Tax=Sulfitobacter alexandrii TaxID=1917485 RepID=A0A1J0WCY6_9RHOB|nr:tRNA (5-methylaminomethyl-2-thiouridine)(34)-methyltransferase MnmD [Sulfitobacter alexandrii]APE42178.1 FAD-dependent oxidoreductase [Sulfitobacter alexandrii]